MPQSLCTPANVFGPFEQHLLFGCSIQSFTVNGGWNQQQGELVAILVEDTCAVPDGGTAKVYYDAFLRRRTTTGADPGFTFPTVGAPVYFRVGDFEFAGILQSYREVKNDGGNPTYEVRIVDPRFLLETSNIIIGDYSGGVSTAYNIFNVYGFMETFGSVCPLTVVNGSTFGSVGGRYGGAFTNEHGMPWNLIKTGLSLLTAAVPQLSNGFSPHGRILGRGSRIGGYGSIPFDKLDLSIPIRFPNSDGYIAAYTLDISELPNLPAFFRLSSMSISIMDAINEVCDESGLDYYIELLPARLGGRIFKFIKVRTASRLNQPNLSAISNFINNSFGTQSTERGHELRNEPTNIFMAGGSVKTIYQIDQDTDPEGDGDPSPATADDIIAPFWGVDNDENVILDDGEKFTVPTDAINVELTNPLNVSTLDIYIDELRAARIGEDQWRNFAGLTNKPSIQALNDAFGVDILGIVGEANPPAAKPINIVGLKPEQSRMFLEAIKKDLTTFFNFINKYATEYMGRKYMVRTPYTCVRLDSDSGEVVTSEEVADGGWSEHPTILSIPNPSLTLEKFINEDRTIGAFVKFNDATEIEISTLDVENYIIYGGALYLSCQPDPKFVFLDFSTRLSPRVVVTLDDTVKRSPKATPIDFRQALLLPDNGAAGKAGLSIQNLLGKDNEPVAPSAFAIPLKSNVNTYGPWQIIGPVGPSKVEKDDSLVPWEFGSIANMNTVALQRVNSAATYMRVSEYGAISVPGYPDIPIGAELGARLGGYFSGGSNLIDTRQILTTTYSNLQSYVYGTILGQAKWVGIYGPNITNISVNVSEQGLTTSYQLRTYTNKFGLFQRQNAERMKKLGERLLNDSKKLRTRQLGNLTAEGKRQSFLDFMRPARNKLPENAASPVEILVTDRTDGNDGFYSQEVALYSVNETLAQVLPTGYENKAIMSLDGLVRGVSIDGRGNLPEYYKGADPHIRNATIAPEPPLENYQNVIVSIHYLNPFTNSSILNLFDGIKNTASTDVCGHDIDVVAKGNVIPSGGLVTSNSGEYSSDYSMFALRGPLLLQGWGYDTQGKPIPNAVDTEGAAQTGNFVRVGLEDHFMPQFLRKSNTWPVGPVDLRFDRERGVWVSPPSFRLVNAILNNALLPFSSGLATITDANTIYNSDGVQLFDDSTDKRVRVYDKIGNSLAAGQRVIMYYDTYKKQYWALTAASSGVTNSDNFVVFEALDTMSAGEVRAKVHNTTASGYWPSTVTGEFLVRDVTDSRPHVISGCLGIAIRDRRPGATAGYIILECDTQAETIHFTIPDGPHDVDAFGQITANISSWYNGVRPVGTSTTILFPSKRQVGSGAQGLAILDREQNKYIVQEVEEMVSEVEGFATAAFTKASSTINIAINRSARGVGYGTSSTTIDVDNPAIIFDGPKLFEGHSGSYVRATRFGLSYRALIVQCPTGTVA
jgi:hypothetical protein